MLPSCIRPMVSRSIRSMAALVCCWPAEAGAFSTVRNAFILHGTLLAVLALGDVEDDDMGVELRRGIAVDGSGGVMLEGRGELSGQLRRLNVADPRLRVPIPLSKSDPNTIAVRLAYPVVSSDKSGQRHRLRR